MSGQVLPHRVQSLFGHETAVKLSFDLRVGDPADVDFPFNVPVTGAVQGKVAEKAHEVGPTEASVLNRHGPHQGGGRAEELGGRLLVLPKAHGVDPVDREGLIIKQDIRPVEADKKQLLLSGCQPLQSRRVPAEDSVSKVLVRVGGWHGGSPFTRFSVPADIVPSSSPLFPAVFVKWRQTVCKMKCLREESSSRRPCRAFIQLFLK